MEALPTSGRARPLSPAEASWGRGADQTATQATPSTLLEAMLESTRQDHLTVLVFAGGPGESEVWAENLPTATVVRVRGDADPTGATDDRIITRTGSAAEQAFLEDLAAEFSPDLVLDRGTPDPVLTFRSLFPALAPGGLYVAGGSEEGAEPGTDGDHPEPWGTDLTDLTQGLVSEGDAEPKDAFEAYCRQTLHSVTTRGNALVFRKRSDVGGRFTRRSVADLAPDAVIVPPGRYLRIPAVAVDASREVEVALRRLQLDSPVAMPPMASAVRTDVLLVVAGVSTTPEGSILSETLNCAQNLPTYESMLKFAGGRAWSCGVAFEPDEVVPADRERPLVLLKQVWDRNYGHWLLDALPKVGSIAALHDPARVRLVLNIRRGGMLKVVRETLALAGFRDDQLLFMDNRPRLFRELTVLGTVSVHPTSKAPRAVSWLSDLGRDLPVGNQSRIYVSRNKYHRRRLENEEELLPVLREFGYEVVHPEELDFAGQVSLFKGAAFVAGNMGAALSNLAFSPDGVTVVALATEGMKHDFFYDLVCHKRGRYRGLQGRATEDADDIGSNFTVAPERLREVLEWAHRPARAA